MCVSPVIFQSPRPETFASPAQLHTAEGRPDSKGMHAPIYETRFIKISLQVRNGRLTVHIYTHVQEGSSVSSFPGRSPGQPGVPSRIMYHRYNRRKTTSTLVRQRPLSSLFSESHDSVKVILPIIIHISRGFRHAGNSDRRRQRNKPRSRNNKTYRTEGIKGKIYIHTKYTVREVYTAFSQCSLGVCLGVALKNDCLVLCHFLRIQYVWFTRLTTETFTDISCVLLFLMRVAVFSVKL